MNHRLWIAASTALASTMIVATPATATAQARAFDIAAQPLSQALGRFGKQADVQIVAPRRITDAKTTRLVRGVFTIDMALRTMLAGTGLTAVRTGAGTYVLRPAQATIVAAAMPLAAMQQTQTPPADVAQAPPTGTLPADDPDTTGEDIVVTGVRASLNYANVIKRRASTIVDSIVAEDIGKLPDNNVAEALQRITGVQITRNQGEGAGISIRGLTQVQTLLNGRNVFTATGRSVSFADLSAELIAGADVYKAPVADMIEGGIGGTVDLRTRRPFDFAGSRISLSARGAYADLAEKWRPEVSALFSDRWNTGIGEMGFLFTATMQKRAYRSDLSVGGAPAARRDAFDANGNGFLGSGAAAEAADEIIVPTAGGLSYALGDRTRWGISGVFQWRPTDTLEVWADGNYNRFADGSDNYSLFTSTGTSGAAANSVGQSKLLNPTFDANGEFLSGTWTNAILDLNSAVSTSRNETYQFAGGTVWKPTDGFDLAAEGAYTRSTARSLYFQNALEGVAPTNFQSYEGQYPVMAFGGVDLTSPASLRFNRLLYSAGANAGDEFAGRIDATYRPDGIVTQVKLGYRRSDRNATSGNTTQNFSFAGTPLAGLRADAIPGLVRPIPVDGLLDKKGGGEAGLLQRWAAPDIAFVRNRGALRSLFGLSPDDPAIRAISTYDLSETTDAVYGRADFGGDIGTVAISGNVGLRYVRTTTSVDGFISRPDGSVAPLNRRSDYDNWLPSVNVKAELTPGLTARLAASKVITRPGFGSLSPALNLNFFFLTGSSGNPDLRPLRADQLDATLEYYFGRSNSLYLAGFHKKVDGFISTRTFSESIGGQTFQIQRPTNGDDGTIKGFEVGWNQFLDFLPGPFDGLGFQANYSYVDSKAPGPLTGQSVPLEGLSKHSYNLIGIYEKGPVSLRVAYNWRNDYVETTAGPGSGSLPLYRAGFGILDASLNVNLDRNLTLTLDGSNLTRPLRVSYFGLPTRPNNTQIEDRRFEAGLRMTF